MILVREAGGNFTIIGIGVKGRCILNTQQSYLLIIILSKDIKELYF